MVALNVWIGGLEGLFVVFAPPLIVYGIAGLFAWAATRRRTRRAAEPAARPEPVAEEPAAA